MLNNRFTPARLEYFQSRENTHLRISIELAIGQSLTENSVNMRKLISRNTSESVKEKEMLWERRATGECSTAFSNSTRLLTGTRDTAPYSSRKQLPIKERKITPLCSLLTCKLSSPVWS